MRIFSWKTFALTLGSLFALLLIQAGYSQTLTVTAAPAALTIYPGQQNVPVAVTLGQSSYAGPISITLTGLPSGITVSPLALTAGGTGTLLLNASPSAGQEGFPVTYPSQNTSFTVQSQVVAAAGSTQATAQLPLTVSISNPGFVPAQSALNLPIVKIDTNGVGIYDKTTDVPGTITITSADGQTSYLPNASDTDNTANFHLHGSSTTAMPKLPYHIKLNTSLDLLNVMGLSCPYVTSGKAKPTCDKSKSYVLLANYDDKTLLHDWAASALANAIPIGGSYLGSPANSPSPSGKATLMPWAPHSLFVELYLNGIYEGNYQLIEQVKVDSHRVNISELAETDVSDDITGGYLLEIDQHKTEAFVFTTPQGLPIGLADPDFTPDPEIPQQTTYISDYVDTAENALFSNNFTDPTLGWRAYFDEASAVNFYIVNDLMGNVDGGDFYSSNYLYKDKDNPLLYMGPIWDFDISAGNVNYEPIVDATSPWMQDHAVWYQQWFKDPGFKADVTTQWNALKNNGVFATWIASIATQAQAMEQSQANNFTRWPMLGMGVWPNAEEAGTYDKEVQYFTNWLQLRFGYLDSQFNSKAQTATALAVRTGAMTSGSPVALTAQVTGGNAPTGQVSFLSGGVLVGVAPLSGGTATLTVGSLAAGATPLEAVYNGDSNNGLSASAQQWVTVGPALFGSVLSVGNPATAYLGASTAFTVAVIPNAGSAVPTGTVTLSFDGGAGVAVPLGGTGTGTYSTSSLALGAHVITATYSGDSNFSGSTASSSITINIAPGFGVSATAVDLTAGSATGNTSTITLSPVGGFTGTVQLSAAILNSPVGAKNLPTLSFGSSSSVILSGAGPVTATLTVSTMGPGSAALNTPSHTGTGWRGAAGIALGGILLCGLSGIRRRSRALLGMLAFLVFLAVGAVGCGGGANNNTTSGTYTVQITATSGSITALGTVTIRVE